MILYTPLFEEEIFGEEESYDEFHWVTINYATLKLKRDTETNSYQIVHMNSTDPGDYLRQEFQPGVIYRI
ncbi:hypothetical protein CEY16_02660 [Halalkalibacillus sediminis]|uniref:Uncharacterized protein n=1 Tax=Halalkalibacillus sediminis TaxID=2018042 RepID=A0A2I0QWF3_9BACI|nr:YlzJ-like family protein [Halalkalibacillus sediminis]PKR78677.1 hypothetical protein CEY16_02660 [Halalkalibacillus sediminis]